MNDHEEGSNLSPEAEASSSESAGMEIYDSMVSELTIHRLSSVHIYPALSGRAGVRLFLVYAQELGRDLTGTSLSFPDARLARSWALSRFPSARLLDLTVLG